MFWLDIKHRQRIAAYIQLMQDTGGNNSGAAGQPIAAIQSQAKIAVNSGEKNRRAVLMARVVIQRSGKKRAPVADVSERVELDGIRRSTFIQARAICHCLYSHHYFDLPVFNAGVCNAV